MASPGNWQSFLEELSAEMRQWLAKEFGFAGEGGADPAALTAAIANLDAEKHVSLDRLRDAVQTLSDDLDRSVDDVLVVHGEIKLPEKAGSTERVLWLWRYHEAIFNEAIELYEYGQRYQKDAYWHGYVAPTAFAVPALDILKAKLEAAFPACFKKPGRLVPAVTVRPFQRPSTRSESRATHLQISVRGDVEILREYTEHGPRRRPYYPERVAAVVLDDKALTIDVVTETQGKKLRKALARESMIALGADFDSAEQLTSRYINLDSLKVRRRFPFSPEDGITDVRFVGVRLVTGRNGFLSFDARTADADDAWQAWENWFSSDGPGFGRASVVGATFEFTFVDERAPKGIKVRTLKLSTPSGLTTKNWPDEHKRIGETLLQRWDLLSPTPFEPE